MSPALRVGHGVDAHAFSDDPARPLVLGGVRIPEAPGLAGHSDGDVVLHAVADALLGAAGRGDLGTLFGTDDPAYAGADSQVFLAGALAQVAEGGWSLVNADATIVGERPRLADHRPRIAGSVARLLGVADGDVNVKVTSTDGMGFAGRGDGVACLAVVLLGR